MSKTVMFTYTSLARDQDFVAAILLAEQELEDLPLRTYPAVDVFSHGSDDAAQQQGNSPYTSTPDLREGHIRLIQLGVDVPTGNIHCTTRIFPLQERPSYTALSYAWGPLRASESRYKILLDGRERLLHKNLWDFLQQASQRRPGWLWIDALSIEQRRAEERSHQVGIMSSLTRSAPSSGWVVLITAVTRQWKLCLGRWSLDLIQTRGLLRRNP